MASKSPTWVQVPPPLTSQTLNCAGAGTATLGAQLTERLAPLATPVGVDGAVTLMLLGGVDGTLGSIVYE